jgi:hypothetical protein
VAAHIWARKWQEGKQEETTKFLELAEPALAAHKRVENFNTDDEVPDEITQLGRVSQWKRSPDEWEEAIVSKIEIAKEISAMAERFLKATTHIPCAIYSEVRNNSYSGDKKLISKIHGNA